MRQEQVIFAAPVTDEALTIDQKQVLERAVAKIVLMGSEVGISPDDMITLLHAGLTVGELLDYIVVCRRESV